MLVHENPKRQKAVALRYEPDERVAPHVVAAGEGEVAKQILEIADLHDVPVYEQPEVVEALVRLEVGAEIPQEFYRVVAEILAFVYSIDKKWEGRKN